MGIPSDLIIAGIILLGLLLVFGIGVDHSLPAFLRNDFDNVCDRYLSILSTNGGLQASDIASLKGELASLNLKNINVTASSATWGNKVTLTVQAQYEYESTSVTLTKQTNVQTMKYENSTIYFGISN